MSVDEARERILDYINYDDAAAGTAIDRLILEVQAEFACEKGIDDDCWDCAEADVNDARLRPRRRKSLSFCPSCTARMKLKETADAR